MQRLNIVWYHCEKQFVHLNEFCQVLPFRLLGGGGREFSHQQNKQNKRWACTGRVRAISEHHFLQCIWHCEVSIGMKCVASKGCREGITQFCNYAVPSFRVQCQNLSIWFCITNIQFTYYFHKGYYPSQEHGLHACTNLTKSCYWNVVFLLKWGIIETSVFKLHSN